jgi:hypothetical protein
VLTDVDEIVLSLNAKALATGEISAHSADIYGASCPRTRSPCRVVGVENRVTAFDQRVHSSRPHHHGPEAVGFQNVAVVPDQRFQAAAASSSALVQAVSGLAQRERLTAEGTLDQRGLMQVLGAQYRLESVGFGVDAARAAGAS